MPLVWISLSLMSVLVIGVLGVAGFFRWRSHPRSGVSRIAYVCLGGGLLCLALFVFAGVPVAVFLVCAALV